MVSVLDRAGLNEFVLCLCNLLQAGLLHGNGDEKENTNIVVDLPSAENVPPL